MTDTQLKELVTLTLDLLTKSQIELENFLNNYSLNELIKDLDEENKEDLFIKTKYLLSDLRHLLVGCENSITKLGVIKRSSQFNKEFAEFVLYETVHLCVNKFYYPEHEIYEEDGRNSYTGRDAIKISFKPNPVIKELLLSLSKYFEVLREELVYYETDYVTKKRLEGKLI